jgi:hypothetical protein
MRTLQFVSALCFVLFSLLTTSCNRKQYAASTDIAVVKKPVEKKLIRKVIKTPAPKIITVDDRAATKIPDGRMYYDFEGKRYWKNFDDGKYYLFNKSMYTNPAFKPH